jgi:hypothetical protein
LLHAELGWERREHRIFGPTGKYVLLMTVLCFPTLGLEPSSGNTALVHYILPLVQKEWIPPWII